MTTDKALFDSP